jgi:helitron helicase-like protein
MALAHFFYNVDLFIMMSMNPAWLKIQWQLLLGQMFYDWPDLVAHVFKLKLSEFLFNILKWGIFGHILVHLYVVEFQKWGLPHIHLLLILHKDDSIRSPSDINSCIATHWPDLGQHPLLFQTVKSCMIHGPCGNVNLNAPCMNEGHCTKGYSKPY